MEHRSARVADSGNDLAQIIGRSTSPKFPGGDLVGPVGPVAIPGNRVVGPAQRAGTPSISWRAPVCSAARCRTRPLGDSPADSPERSAGWVLYYAAVQLGGEPVDLPGQLRVGLEFKLLLGEVVVGLRLLERRLPVLADHHER